MSENKEGLTEDEFGELFRLSTDEQRLEICRMLAKFVKENPETSGFTDEQIAEGDEKFDRYAQAIEDKNRAHELLHRAENAQKLAEDRINARFADIAETESSLFSDGSKNNRTH